MSRVIGEPISRLDGPAKVSGQARYTADTPVPGLLFAAFVSAPRAHARIDLTAASAAPGVVRIFTHRNTPKLKSLANPPAGHTILPLQDGRVLYEGQPVALVVADTLERATEAARLVQVSYRDEPFQTDFLTQLHRAESAPLFSMPPDASTGDVRAAWAEAEVRLERTYATADRHHNTMEPSATIAVWQDGQLLLHDAVQGVVHARDTIAQILQIDPKAVRVRNEFVGGGFGCKGWIWPHQVLAAIAARELGRPVKLVLTRAQTYTAHGYQPASRQTVALSARADGTLTGIRHDSLLAGSFVGDHVEPAGWGTRALYASPASQATHRVVRVHRGNPTPMRAPLEGIGLVAVEIAMDELAYEIGVDPLALRLRNYAETDVGEGRPFSSKRLRECYELGAQQFGWARREMAPCSMRDGRDLVGYGMATALFKGFRNTARVRVSIDRAGRVLLETSTQEIGTGTRTIFPQIAAEILEVPVESVTITLGDTNLPAAPMTAGSMSTGTVGAAVQDGARKLKARLAELGGNTPASYREAVARSGLDVLDKISPETRFDAAYKAIMQSALVALMAHGYRPDTNRPGHHATVIQALPTTIGVRSERLALLDALRRRRNLSAFQCGRAQAHQMSHSTSADTENLRSQ